MAIGREYNPEERIYMVVGEDENGDYLAFATSHKGRAKARLEAAKTELANVKANWLEFPDRMASPGWKGFN